MTTEIKYLIKYYTKDLLISGRIIPKYFEGTIKEFNKVKKVLKKSNINFVVGDMEEVNYNYDSVPF